MRHRAFVAAGIWIAAWSLAPAAAQVAPAAAEDAASWAVTAGLRHGIVTAEQSLEAYRVIHEFLTRHLAPSS
jgi:hypothetical protein